MVYEATMCGLLFEFREVSHLYGVVASLRASISTRFIFDVICHNHRR